MAKGTDREKGSDKPEKPAPKERVKDSILQRIQKRVNEEVEDVVKDKNKNEETSEDLQLDPAVARAARQIRKRWTAGETARRDVDRPDKTEPWTPPVIPDINEDSGPSPEEY